MATETKRETDGRTRWCQSCNRPDHTAPGRYVLGSVGVSLWLCFDCEPAEPGRKAGA